MPVHGEAAHLTAQAEPRSCAGIKTIPKVRNGNILRQAPGDVQSMMIAPHGRIFKDGKLIGDID